MIDKKKYLYYFIYFVFGIFYFIFLKTILDIINVYYVYIKEVLIILFILIGLFIPFINKKILMIIYFIYLFIFLFLREIKFGVNFNFYLISWLKNIFNNKIIFVNILGNILLYIPLGIIFYKKIIYSFILVIMLELIQLICMRGIFDIVDILLNYIGVSIGVLGVLLWMKIKTKTEKMKIKMKK